MQTVEFPRDTAGRLPILDYGAAARQSRQWVDRVIALLDAAVRELHNRAPQCILLEAAALLRENVAPQATAAAAAEGGRLLTWQARKVRDYVDSHITDSLAVADLCALIQRSEAHFSRSFRRTFGESPHAFVIRRRLQLAEQYMLRTDAPLSDIALRCGFTDQAHLCRHFRRVTGHTPAAWRRARRIEEKGALPASSESLLAA